MNEQTASAALMSATQSIALFTTFLPPLSEVRKSLGDTDTVNDVRMGEVAASALCISIGLMASSLVGSPVPAGVAVVAAAGLVVMYESVLATPPREMVKTG